MCIPKIKFKLPTLEREANMLYGFCHPRPTGWDWSGRVYKQHPELKKLVVGIKNKDKFFDQCSKYANKFIKENKKELKGAVADFQKEWDKFGEKYLKILSKHFETNYPKNKKIIIAYVSINPICPRFLDEWSFNVQYNRPEYMRRIATHEIMHFLHFKKWLEVFPNTKRKEMDSPYLVWKLSEILAPIISNHHPEIHKMVKAYSPGYKEFQDIKIGGKKLIPYFENLYKKHLTSKNSFEDFLKLCWERSERYGDVINKT
ncbi:TPA: hypothetical protein DDY55_04140 [Candidatus Falkowbacteria bacterium]|nr:hypothetical protein [Candidatus Falkowbacteria bacterium]HAY12117.1 hypothetical protein [Candidatus Falkowbacteria bacterium]HBI97278.1 hypothetical protein [Candidatus Falkowbacteria bacterium]HBT28021.1 hypothetical protein [Candidatus Falkowbacteria bacterium]HBY14485.1 hypothetical protein [Candidatus Falkowbacteria bacterium]